MAYAEEYAPFRPAAERDANEDGQKPLSDRCKREIWKVTAKIAAQQFDYAEYPSAYCLFETFCPGDRMDEVLENALEWKKYADTLPEQFCKQVERIWRLWTENRAALAPIYKQLPSSVFQADLNPTNILLDDKGDFVGMYDFNLCGREVFLNYLMRENFGPLSKEVPMIRDALRIASEYYRFSESEKNLALMLFRCLKPLSFICLDTLKEAETDPEAIRKVLDETEYHLTADIDFTDCMGE